MYKRQAYKSTHKNHPCTVWVRETRSNYLWAVAHWKALGDEYTKRYGKVHATIQTHSETLTEAPRGIPDGDFTDPPQCMPDDCKRDDAVLGYQVYYNYKADDWDARGIPMRWYGREAV